MSFSAELKDFLGGFKGGWKLVGEAEDREIKRETNEIRKDLAAERIATSKAARDETEGARAAYRGDGKDVERFDRVGVNVDGAPRTPTFVELEKNITAQESGGNYKAVGPTHPKLGRALGYAQVMEANLPKWSQAALGRTVSADEFLENPDLQKQIVRHRLGGYYNQYGPEGAASMWFTGKPRPSGKRDSLGTRDYDYVNRAVGRRAALELDDEEERPVYHAASGGLIEDDYAGNDESGGSNPAVRDAVEGKDVDDDLGMDMAYDPQVPRIMAGASEMANVALEDISRRVSPRAGVGEVAPDNQQGLQALAHNAGAATPREVEALRKVGDPQGKLPSKQLAAIAGFHRMYEYYMQRGDAGKAQNAARGMLMFSKQAAQMAGTTMQAALDDGNIEGAAKIAEKAYNENLLDGQRMEVTGKGKNGMKFKMYDEETGEMTNQGEATMDQMVKLATGLQNGTEWFRASNVLAQKRPVDKVGQRNERERAAAEEYNAEATQGARAAFLEQMPEKQREKFSKLPTRMQNAEVAQWLQQEAAAGRDTRFETRRQDSAWKEAIKHDRWMQDRERMMSRDELAASQRQQDLDDRNSRFDQSQEARLARQRATDAAVLGRRGAAAGRGGSAGERADQALDLGRGEARADVYRSGDPNDELGVSPQTAERLGAVDAGIAFNKVANDPKRQFTQEMSKEVQTVLTEEFKDVVKTPDTLNSLNYIGEEIARTSNVRPDQAARITMEAMTKGAKVQRDGSVLVGNHPPVFMSSRSILELARLRGLKNNPKGKEEAGVAREADNKGASPTGNVSGVVVGERAPMGGMGQYEQRSTDDELPGGRGRVGFKPFGVDVADLYDKRPRSAVPDPNETWKYKNRRKEALRRYGVRGN